jgi:hypothetical protein
MRLTDYENVENLPDGKLLSISISIRALETIFEILKKTRILTLAPKDSSYLKIFIS